MSIASSSLPASAPILKILARPQDVNTSGDIFGGWLMSQVDIAGGLVAADRGRGRVATVAVNSFQFLKPVKVGDLVMCFAEIIRIGKTSIGVDVQVFIERRLEPSHEAVHLLVAEAHLVYVCLDRDGRARPVPAD